MLKVSYKKDFPFKVIVYKKQTYLICPRQHEKSTTLIVIFTNILVY